MKQLSIILGVLLIGFIAGYSARYVQLKTELNAKKEALHRYQELAEQEAAYSLNSKKETEIVSRTYHELGKEIGNDKKKYLLQGDSLKHYLIEMSGEDYSSINQALAILNLQNKSVPKIHLSNDWGDLIKFKLLRTNRLSDFELKKIFAESVMTISDIRDVKIQFDFKQRNVEKSITFERADFIDLLF